ncbi:MAG: SH3 domain-containing protein [Lachnospiraceae bacterium]|nr:SH3 domain-containing protein [Lachnospiraceae bacterium]
MKYAMYAIMALLTVMVAILAYMSANKPPVSIIESSVNEEVRHREREILFNVTPIPDAEDNFLPETDSFTEEPEEDEDPDIIRLDLMMYVISSVNIRSGHSTDFDRVGSLSANQEVRVTGQSRETNWYRIEFGDGYAFVSNNYLEERNTAAANEPEYNTTDFYEPNPEDIE